MSLINREELLKSITDDGGLQYPRWWYVDKVKTAPEAVIHCKDCIYGEYDCMFDTWWCMGHTVKEDHFCGRGKMRENGRPD